MKRIYNKLQRTLSKFRAKLLLAFFICTLLPLGILAAIFYQVTYQIASEKIMNSAILADDQLNVQINDRIRQTENVADSIQYDMYTLSQTNGSITDTLTALNNVRNDICLFKTTFGFYHIFVFLPDTDTGAGEGLYFHPLSMLPGFALPENSPKNPGTDSIWFYQPKVVLPFVLSENQTARDVIACCRLLRNQSSQLIEYAYLIFLNPDEFSDFLQETFGSTEITSYLVSEEGQIMGHTNPQLSGSKISPDVQQLYTENPKTVFTSDNIHYHAVRLDNGWYHVTEIPESYIRENTRVLLKTIIITLIIAIPLTVLIIVMISGNLSKRLKNLSLAMENFRLQKSPETNSVKLIPHSKDPASYDEIDNLSLTFENMQESINQNMKAILELSLSEEKLKYQLLQSQINPHFLYNILGTIKTCQSIGKLDTAERMITNLTAFYRLTLRKSGELIAIRDELEIARLYLELEKLCHNDNLTWDIYWEDGIENFSMCRFTLQPFLENCILHGISGSTPVIHINLNVCYGDDTVIITIKDNGAGIPPELLKELQDTLKSRSVNYEKHFGIGNVNKRISSPSFGNGTVHIDSHHNEGTEITIIFEQMEEV